MQAEQRESGRKGSIVACIVLTLFAVLMVRAVALGVIEPLSLLWVLPLYLAGLGYLVLGERAIKFYSDARTVFHGLALLFVVLATIAYLVSLLI